MKTAQRYRKTRSITPDPVLWDKLISALPAGSIRNASLFFDEAVTAYFSGKKITKPTK